MSNSGKLWIKVETLLDGPELSGATQLVNTSPYIALTLHDGNYAAGGYHIGEKISTAVQSSAGSNATWDQEFLLSKTGIMDNIRIELWDKNILLDDMLGSIDLDLKTLFNEEYVFGEPVSKTVELVKSGQEKGKVHLKLKFTDC